MVNQPETPEKEPFNQPQKLVLPALPDDHTPELRSASPQMPIPPEYLIRRQSAPPPQNPLARLHYFWHKDPAYKVLLFAVALVLVAGTLFVSLISNAIVHNSNFFAASSALPQTPPTTTGTLALRPTFAPPGGGKGSKTSSLPPAHGTVNVPSTPTQPDPTPGAGGGTLTVQITDLPTNVRNYQSVTVRVTTSEPGAAVYLSVKYNVPPHRDFAGPNISDGNGNATLNWLVMVYKVNGARASVVAIAKDQNGQQAQSQPLSVQISGFGG